MLENVLRYIKNWFVVPGGIHIDHFVIRNGGITLPFLQDGQYYRIVGSVFNDGVHKYDDSLLLTDEEFHGAVWALAIPSALIDLVSEIEQWQIKNGEAAASPLQSESFGGYSYTKKSGDNSVISWQSAFETRLEQWRKL